MNTIEVMTSLLKPPRVAYCFAKITLNSQYLRYWTGKFYAYQSCTHKNIEGAERENRAFVASPAYGDALTIQHALLFGLLP